MGVLWLISGFSEVQMYKNNYCFQTSLQRKDIDHIVDRLSEKAAKVCNDGVVGENKEATERVQYFTSLAEAVKERRAQRKEQIISLTPLPGTSKAVAQSVSPQVRIFILSNNYFNILLFCLIYPFCSYFIPLPRYL